MARFSALTIPDHIRFISHTADYSFQLLKVLENFYAFPFIKNFRKSPSSPLFVSGADIRLVQTDKNVKMRVIKIILQINR